MCVYTVNHCYPLDVRDFCLAQFFYHHHYFQKLENRNKTDNLFFKYKNALTTKKGFTVCVILMFQERPARCHVSCAVLWWPVPFSVCFRMKNVALEPD